MHFLQESHESITLFQVQTIVLLDIFANNLISDGRDSESLKGKNLPKRKTRTILDPKT